MVHCAVISVKIGLIGPSAGVAADCTNLEQHSVADLGEGRGCSTNTGVINS